MQPTSYQRPNYFIFIIAAIAALGGFLFGFDSSVIANTKDQIVTQFSLSEFEWSKVVSISILGSMIAIPCSGIISDRVSRKSLLLIVAAGFILGSVMCAQAKQVNMLYLGRFLIGACIGVASYAAPLFIAEMSPRKLRGGLILMNGIAITFGQAASFLVGYLLHDISSSSWRLLLWSGTIPAACLFIGMLFIPHSPRWLMMKFGLKDAYKVLKAIRPDKDELELEFAEIESSMHQKPIKPNGMTLLSKPFVYVLLLGLILGILQQFSGINAIMYYGPVIFEIAGFHPIKSAILATSWLGFLNFIFTIITLYWVDKLGRRFFLLSGLLLAAAGLFALSAYYAFSPVNKDKWLLLSFASIYIIGYCISVGSLFWVIISEIYPHRLRGLAMSIAAVVQWAANFLVSISFLTLFHQLGELEIFWLFGAICSLGFIVTYYYVPETAGISLEHIESNLLAGKKLREIGCEPSVQPKTANLLSTENVN